MSMGRNDDFISVFIVLVIGFLASALIISVGVGGYDKGKYEVWRQAVEKGYAQEIETSEGKVFQWK